MKTFSEPEKGCCVFSTEIKKILSGSGNERQHRKDVKNGPQGHVLRKGIRTDAKKKKSNL